MTTALRIASVLPLILLVSAASDSVLRLPSEAAAAAATTTQREFDYFLLSLQWPGTLCSRTLHCCPKNGCCRSQPLKEFTIHGLWSNYDAGGWPSCCDGPDFDIKKISSLIPELNKYWPTLSCGSSSVCHGGKGIFWAHEWEKHGTCSASVTKDEYSYFTTALGLYRKYNITAILNTAGILATNSQTYSLGDIVATIEKAVGASPSLVCNHGSIEELRLCFYKDFTPRDCVLKSSIINGTSNLQSSCPRYISLPTYAPMVPADVNAASPLLSNAFGPLSQMIKSLWG